MDALQKILSVSVELFRQYGFKTITMDDIARRAGISKKTLYQHFVNKQEVVHASLSWYQEQIRGSIQEAMETAENAVEGMVRIMGLLDQMYRQINPLALLELQRFFPEAYKLFRGGMVEKDVADIVANIRQGIAEGLYREGINPELLARYRIETCLILFQPNMLVSDAWHPQLVNHELSEHFLYGIMTAKGERLYNKYKEKYLKQVVRL